MGLLLASLSIWRHFLQWKVPHWAKNTGSEVVEAGASIGKTENQKRGSHGIENLQKPV